MKLIKFKGNVMIMVIIIMLFLSILIISLLTMMLCRYQSVISWVDYQECFYLAMGGMDESISFLNELWLDTEIDWSHLGEGEYHYDISSINTNTKRIISQGKKENVLRKIEIYVQRPSFDLDLLALSKGIYCEGNLFIEDLGNITNDETIPNVCVNGNVIIEDMTKGEIELMATGYVNFDNGNKEDFFKHCNVIPWDTYFYNMCSAAIYWDIIVSKFPNKNKVFSRPGEDMIITQSQLDLDKDINYFHHIEDLVIRGVDSKGVIIIEDVNKVIIEDDVNFEGVLIIVGNNINDVEIDGLFMGSILIFDMEDKEIHLKGQVKYHKDYIEKYNDYICEKISCINCTKRSINVIKWNEIE